MEQHLLVSVCVENKIVDKIKNVNDVYAFKHFVKMLYHNVGNIDEFNTQADKDNCIQYSLNIM
ncbi:17250_t:CDS:1, partial [Gigaspora margarita]